MADRQKYTVKLTDEQRTELDRIIVSTSKKITAQTKVRAKVLKYLDTDSKNPLTPEQAANKAKLCRETVYSLRKKFCIEGLEAVLFRKKRKTPPVEPKVTAVVEAYIIAAACSSPPQGKSRWTLQMIKDKIVLDAIIDDIGKETVRRALKKHNSSLI